MREGIEQVRGWAKDRARCASAGAKEPLCRKDRKLEF
jgi:hypothetical protein